MKLDKVNFKKKSARFEFSEGKQGKDEKKLIKESMDILTQKHTARDLMLDPTDKNVRKESKRYEKIKEKLKNGNLEYTDLLADNIKYGDSDDDDKEDDASKNQITYSNVCDMITAIHEHIRVLEESGIGFNSGSEEDREKYTLLRNALNNLNEMRGQLTRTVQHPNGLFRRKKRQN